MPAGVSPDPPPEVGLARPVARIPAENALPGGSRYELKYDGFRLVMHVQNGTATLWSRQRKDLTRSFPDLAAAAVAQLPDGVTIDGEAVVWTDGRLDFDTLLRRLNAGRGLTAIAREKPASFVAFDILTVAGQDARSLRLDDRRALLEELAADWMPPLNLSPVTRDADEAAEWFDAFTASGVEGLVVKAGAGAYRGGERDWLKVKHRDTIDVICAAVTGPREHPRDLVIGLPVDGELRIVGRSTPLGAAASRDLSQMLQPPQAPHPWPTEVKPGAVDRFNRSGREPVQLTLVEPIVVEISADIAMTGTSFRHAVRFLRARPEIPTAEVTQLHRR